MSLGRVPWCRSGAVPGPRGIVAGQPGVVSSFLLVRSGCPLLMYSLLDESVNDHEDFCWSICSAIGQNKLTCDWLAWLSWSPEKGCSETCVRVKWGPEKGCFASVKMMYCHVGVPTHS